MLKVTCCSCYTAVLKKDKEVIDKKWYIYTIYFKFQICFNNVPILDLRNNW